MLSEPCFQSPLPRAGPASCSSQDLGAVGPVTCQELQTLQQHPGWKQEEADARTVHWGLSTIPLGRPRTKQIVLKK